MSRMQNTFSTVRTEGSLLPADFLQRLLTPKPDIEGLRSENYHLVGRERIDDAASRSWLRLVGAWTAFRGQLQRLSADDTATTITREKWLYVLFSELNYGRLEAAKGIVAEGKPYPISHLSGSVPLHLVGANIDLDKRTKGAAGAATMSPHGLVQELLNRSDDYLWGVVSNGRVLRVLRDNAAMTRQAFVEFDLEAMFEGQEYHDFVLLWMLLHESRFEAERPEECWLEKWVATSRSQGTRALDALRGGVEAAITALGTGLVSHRGNVGLKTALRDGHLDKHDLYRQVLRVVYRLIFLFATEDRELVFAPGATREAKDRYLKYYSVSRLRRLAEQRRGDGHSDLWQQLLLTFELFATGEGEDSLGVPFIGGLFRDNNPLLANSQVSNLHLLEAVRALTTVSDGKARRRVDYRNLGAEELGSVYESLLEQHPSLNLETGSFELGTIAGSERKTTGSYYTPSSLISLLLDSALEPVLDERIATARKDKRDVQEAILDLKVCDPTCGSGHFLIAAAHRIARELARVRTGDDEPSPVAQRHALRDVVSRCIYGVDINPMAVELAKVGLWLEAIEPGKPLTFLDHHVKQGNSLLGATPALIERGLPDGAFNPIEGDDKKIANAYKKRNRLAREGGQMDLFAAETRPEYGRRLSEGFAQIDAMPEVTAADLDIKQQRFEELKTSEAYRASRLLGDLFCAAFVWPKNTDSVEPVTEAVVQGLRDGNTMPDDLMLAEVERLSRKHAWFHWHVEFPDAFTPTGISLADSPTGWNGGFDCVLGNPPWGQMQVEQKQYFSARGFGDIANAKNASERQRMVATLFAEYPQEQIAFSDALDKMARERSFVAESGRFPLSAIGKLNTYRAFAETMTQIVRREGRIGCIIPTGVAVDYQSRLLFADIVKRSALVCLYDFADATMFFPDIATVNRVCLLVLLGSGTHNAVARVGFMLPDISALADESCTYELSSEEIALVSPLSLSCPAFAGSRAKSIVTSVHRRWPVLGGLGYESPWRAHFRQGLFNMASSSGLFSTLEPSLEEGRRIDGARLVGDGAPLLPLVESKLFHLFNHRAKTFEGVEPARRFRVKAEPNVSSVDSLRDPSYSCMPRYWVSETALNATMPDSWTFDWLLLWKDVARVQTNSRTLVACLAPRWAVGDTASVLFVDNASARTHAVLTAILSSFVLDFVTRQKVTGAHVSLPTMAELPVPPPAAFSDAQHWTGEESLGGWLQARVLELTYTSYDMAPFARDLGFDGPPFVWDEERRFDLRCQLDAAIFQTYGLEGDDVEYVLDSFPIVENEEVRRLGEYRTKRRILELFDEYSGHGHG